MNKIEKYINDNYKVGDYFLLLKLTTKFEDEKSNVIKTLNKLTKDKVIEFNYRFICPKCQEVSDEFYRNIKEIPSEYKCKECNEEFSFREDTVGFVLHKIGEMININDI